jgi:hypothetical protein
MDLFLNSNDHPCSTGSRDEGTGEPRDAARLVNADAIVHNLPFAAKHSAETTFIQLKIHCEQISCGKKTTQTESGARKRRSSQSDGVSESGRPGRSG